MIPARDEGRDKTNALQPATPEQLDLGPGQWMIARGNPTEFFTIGALARALNWKPITLRKLQAVGQLPKSGWQAARVGERASDDSIPGPRSRPPSGSPLRKEGILVETWRAVSKTGFRDRLIKAWKELGD
jgi:hypothetical protein